MEEGRGNNATFSRGQGKLRKRYFHGSGDKGRRNKPSGPKGEKNLREKPQKRRIERGDSATRRN